MCVTHPAQRQDILDERGLDARGPDVQIEAVLGEGGGVVAPPLLTTLLQLPVQQLVHVQFTLTRRHHIPRLFAYFCEKPTLGKAPMEASSEILLDNVKNEHWHSCRGMT